MIRVCVRVCAVCQWTTSLLVCVHSVRGGREIASPRKSALHLPPADSPAYITTLLPVRCTSPSALSLYYPFIPLALSVSLLLSPLSLSLSLSLIHPLFVTLWFFSFWLSCSRVSLLLLGIININNYSQRYPCAVLCTKLTFLQHLLMWGKLRTFTMVDNILFLVLD